MTKPDPKDPGADAGLSHQDTYQSELPEMHQSIYLDYAATTPLLPSVQSKMLELFQLELGNASALHTPGHRTKQIIETARFNIARLINARPEEIIFTSGGTESNNTVAHTFANQKIATSTIEHPSMLISAKHYASRHTPLPVDRWGKVKSKCLPRDVDLVSVMLANNEIGTVQPLAEISAQIDASNQTSQDSEETRVKNDCSKISTPKRRAKTFLHSDATQALGKIKIDVKALNVDYLTLSAHKIGGPVGVGALYVRQGAPLKPLILGGHQENKRRAGTSNTIAIAGFGEAARWCWDNWSCQKYSTVATLRDTLAQRILAEIPYSSLNTPLDCSLPNILNVSFQAAEGESIQLYLDAANITVSTGSACAAGDIKPSHVLMATTGDAEVAHSSVRFSLGLDTTFEEVNRVMQVLPGIIKRLQGISTIKIKSPEKINV